VQHVESAFHHSQAVRDLLAHPLMAGRAIFPAYPEGDKWTRAQPFAAQVTGNNVYLMRRAWTEQFIEELIAFPFGAHDDQVDAAVGAYLALVKEEETRKLVGGVVRYA
jgi:predicted phage terminase large subunit-like protein